MDIRCTSTGKVFFQFPTEVAALLLEAFPGSFERATPASPANTHTHGPARPKVPTFLVGDNRQGLLCLFLRMPSGEIQQYQGSPDEARKAFAGFQVPDGVLEEYRLTYEAQHRPVHDVMP